VGVRFFRWCVARSGVWCAVCVVCSASGPLSTQICQQACFMLRACCLHLVGRGWHIYYISSPI
jgi:hypothetical protein